MTTKPTTILLSGRDPGAVGNINALLSFFRTNPLYKIELVASGTAADILKNLGQNPTTFSLPDQRDHFDPKQEDTQSLLQAAHNLLEKLQPDIVITSLSSFGVGIDEALLATAQVPTFALQDFWGDVNLGLGVPATLYLTIDDFAADLTKKRWKVEALAVGAPKYAFYETFNIPKMRQTARKQCRVKPTRKIIGWFGQSPEIPGHEETFRSFLDALKKLDRQHFTLLLREHPKFLQARDDHIVMTRKSGIECYDATGEKNAEDWLAASDLIVTPFSLCGLDHAHLCAYSPEPLGAALYMMTNKEVRSFAEEYSGILKFPIVEQGVGFFLDDNKPEKIVEALLFSLETREAHRYFQNSKNVIKKFDFKYFQEVICKSL